MWHLTIPSIDKPVTLEVNQLIGDTALDDVLDLGIFLLLLLL